VESSMEKRKKKGLGREEKNKNENREIPSNPLLRQEAS